MTNKPVTPVSVISDVRHLAQALYQDRIAVITDRAEIDTYGNGLGGMTKVYAQPRQWAEIGGITNQRAAAILKDFLDEFQEVLTERDQLKAAMRQIAETAIKAGDV